MLTQAANVISISPWWVPIIMGALALSQGLVALTKLALSKAFPRFSADANGHFTHDDRSRHERIETGVHDLVESHAPRGGVEDWKGIHAVHDDVREMSKALTKLIVLHEAHLKAIELTAEIRKNEGKQLLFDLKCAIVDGMKESADAICAQVGKTIKEELD